MLGVIETPGRSTRRMVLRFSSGRLFAQLFVGPRWLWFQKKVRDTEDGSVVTWGSAGHGGDSSAVQSQLTNIRQIQSTAGAFAAMREERFPWSVFTSHNPGVGCFRGLSGAFPPFFWGGGLGFVAVPFFSEFSGWVSEFGPLKVSHF